MGKKMLTYCMTYIIIKLVIRGDYGKNKRKSHH